MHKFEMSTVQDGNDWEMQPPNTHRTILLQLDDNQKYGDRQALLNLYETRRKLAQGI